MYHRFYFSLFATLVLTTATASVGQFQTFVNQAIAQDSSNYTLVIEGEELQNCIITVRYFRNRQLTKTVVNRSTLAAGRAEEPLESQHDGLEVIIQSAGIPMSARILRQGKVQKEETTDKSGFAKLALGKIGRAPFQPISIELSKREKLVIESLAVAISKGNSAGNLVSESPSANIDGPCLDVFLRELKKIIGDPQNIETASDGWLGYGKNEDSRTLVGVIKGQHGVCGFKANLEKGKLLDLVPNCQLLPDNFFREPIALKEYTRRAKLLTQNLFAGNAEKAHAQYSPKFQAQVTTDQLKQLCELVQTRYGKSIEAIEFKRSDLLDYNFEQHSSLLTVDLLIQTDRGARCISRTSFSIPSGRNQIGKAHLGAVNIFQVFQSSQPECSQAAEKLLAGLSQNMRAAELVSQFPDELQKLAKSDEIDRVLSRIAEQLDGAAPEVDFDLWTVTETDVLITASGPIKYGNSDCYVELQFNGNKQILGFSFYGPALSESTLGAFEFDERVKQIAEQYWNQLLKEEAESAYAMLHPDFQKQFPLDELKSQLESPQSETSPIVSVTSDYLRLSSNPFRATPFLVSAYLTARFENGESQPVTCDLPMTLQDDSTTGVIYDFSNEFEIDFPVADIPIEIPNMEGLQAIIDAFISANSTKLIALINPASHSAVDAKALDAYLEKLIEIGGKLGPSKSVSRTVEYLPGTKRFRGNAILISEKGEPLQIESWFQNGFLERFSISDPRLIDFVSLLEDTSEVERRVERFIASWLTDKEDVGNYLLPSIRSEAMLKTLSGLRDNFVTQHGNYESMKIVEKQPYRGGGILQFDVALTGVESSKNISVSVEVGAFGGFISGVTF